jgi:hypothetical protein
MALRVRCVRLECAGAHTRAIGGRTARGELESVIERLAVLERGVAGGDERVSAALEQRLALDEPLARFRFDAAHPLERRKAPLSQLFERAFLAARGVEREPHAALASRADGALRDERAHVEGRALRRIRHLLVHHHLEQPRPACFVLL